MKVTQVNAMTVYYVSEVTDPVVSSREKLAMLSALPYFVGGHRHSLVTQCS